MSQVNFGVGDLFIVPSGANPTPIQVGELQEVTLDYTSTKKLLEGSRQFAIASADSLAKLTGKAKIAKVDGALIAAILAGSSTPTTGQKQDVRDEVGTVATAVITVTGSANFAADLGVYSGPNGTGTKYTRVASAPTAGQYSVSAGAYAFNASENGNVLYLSYTKTASGAGKTIALPNASQQLSTTFAVYLYNRSGSNAGKVLAGKIFAAVFSKLQLAFKNSDFTIPDVDFEALDDGSGNVAEFYVDNT